MLLIWNLVNISFLCNSCHADTVILNGKLRKYNANKTTDQLRLSPFLHHVSCPIPAGECLEMIVNEQIVYGEYFKQLL